MKLGKKLDKEASRRTCPVKLATDMYYPKEAAQ
jgi:hypothetical protein